MLTRCLWLGVAFAAAVLLSASPAVAAPDKSQWVAQCADRLKQATGSRRSIRRYCACMYDTIGDTEDGFGTDLERTYPPVHAMCRNRAGRN